MDYSAFVDFETPARSTALQPVRRWLNHPTRHEVIALSIVPQVLLKGGDPHSRDQGNRLIRFVLAGIAM
jgi:hypothetical protein